MGMSNALSRVNRDAQGNREHQWGEEKKGTKRGGAERAGLEKEERKRETISVFPP